ncbi:MAG: AAA family ATPase [Lachnospiraceae bacterium]|nr:AAA family ATPase [Lachnospiraceae bacterium]
MRAAAEIKRSDGSRVGFLVDNMFLSIEEILSNADRIENLTVSEKGTVELSGEALPVQTLYEYHKTKYLQTARENPLNREIQKEFRNWKKHYNKYVLYVSGARQTGKTTEILKFAYGTYENILYINLANDSLKVSLEKCLNSQLNIVLALMDFCKENKMASFINSADTVVILDEIQESTVIYNSIRRLSELRGDIIVTGSYLGKTLSSEYFKPVGNVWQLEMLPLSFTEFCDVFGCRNLLQTIDITGHDADENYEILSELYMTYRKIGGYPAVVSAYVKDRSVEKCMEILESILQIFTEESSAYFHDFKSALVFQQVYKEILRMMSMEKKGTSSKDIKTITRFTKEDTKEHVSRKEVNEALAWLKYSKIIGGCDLYNQGNVFDVLYERRMYFMDCGILNCIAARTPIDNATLNGLLSENFAYSELYRLYKTHQVKGDKPCCSVYGDYELDFMIVDQNDRKYGLEIKTSDSHDPRSLLVYLSDGKIEKGYLAGNVKGGERGRYLAIPIYTVGCRFPYQ